VGVGGYFVGGRVGVEVGSVVVVGQDAVAEYPHCGEHVGVVVGCFTAVSLGAA